METILYLEESIFFHFVSFPTSKNHFSISWKAFPACENHLHDPVECLFLFFIHFFLSKPCRRSQKASLSFSIFHFCLFLLVRTIFLYIGKHFFKNFWNYFYNPVKWVFSGKFFKHFFRLFQQVEATAFLFLYIPASGKLFL